MAEENPEVKIALRVDDQSTSVLDSIKQGFSDVHKHSDGVNDVLLKMVDRLEGVEFHMHDMKGHMSGAKEESKGLFDKIGEGSFKLNEMLELAHKLIEPFKKAAEFVKEMGMEALNAADASDMQSRAMSNLMGLMDHGAHSMRDIKTYAEGIRGELEETALKTGSSMGEVTDIFNSVIERGGVSTEKAKQLTEQMAVVGRVIPGGASSLAQAFDGLEMGMIRARSPLAQLISSTGVLKGTAADVAKEMQKMTQEERMKKAMEAIGRQSGAIEKSGGVPVSMGMVKQNLDTMKEAFFESMGKPMLEHLIPPINAVKNFLETHVEEIKDFGEKVSTYMAQGIDALSAIFGGVYSAVKEGWEDIAGTLTSATHLSNETKAQLSESFKSMTKDLIDAAKWVINAIKTVADYIQDAVHEVGNMGKNIAQLFGGKGGEVGLSSVEERTVKDVRSKSGAIGEGTQAAFDESADAYRRVALEAGRSTEEVDSFISKLRDYRDTTQRAAESVKDAAAAGNVDVFGNYLNQAIANNNDASLTYAVNILKNNDGMQKAIVDGSLKVEGGFNDFIRMLKDKAPELAEHLKKMSDPIKLEGGIQGGRSINFINNTFHMQQKFDQDPDRIVQVFRRDLQQAAVARLHSRVSVPFGL